MSIENAIKDVTGNNNKLLDDFKNLMDTTEVPKQIEASDLFDRWIQHVEENVDTDGLEIEFDDEFDDKPHYEYIEVVAKVIKLKQPDWSSCSRAVIHFSCEHDENMNQKIH